MNTISRWHLAEMVSGRITIILGDFNQTPHQLCPWQSHHDLTRAHHNLGDIAQHHLPRSLRTYERSNARTHIDHIFYSHLGPLQLTQIGATDHPHILEKTTHLNRSPLAKPPGKYPLPPRSTSDCQSLRPLLSDDPTAAHLYTAALEQFVTGLDLDPQRIATLTPTQASQFQAEIMSTSSKLAQQSNPKPRPKRPSGHGKRFKDGFSPDFRLLQLTLHSYINLQRLHNRPRAAPSSLKYRRRELRKLWTRWLTAYQKYFPDTMVTSHPDCHLYSLDLEHISLESSLLIDIPTRLQRRMHGRQRSLLRSLLTDRTRAMQTNLAFNKLRRVIRMVLLKS